MRPPRVAANSNGAGARLVIFEPTIDDVRAVSTRLSAFYN